MVEAINRIRQGNSEKVSKQKSWRLRSCFVETVGCRANRHCWKICVGQERVLREGCTERGFAVWLTGEEGRKVRMTLQLSWTNWGERTHLCTGTFPGMVTAGSKLRTKFWTPVRPQQFGREQRRRVCPSVFETLTVSRTRFLNTLATFMELTKAAKFPAAPPLIFACKIGGCNLLHLQRRKCMSFAARKLTFCCSLFTKTLASTKLGLAWMVELFWPIEVH